MLPRISRRVLGFIRTTGYAALFLSFKTLRCFSFATLPICIICAGCGGKAPKFSLVSEFNSLSLLGSVRYTCYIIFTSHITGLSPSFLPGLLRDCVCGVVTLSFRMSERTSGLLSFFLLLQGSCLWACSSFRSLGANSGRALFEVSFTHFQPRNIELSVSNVVRGPAKHFPVFTPPNVLL